MKVCLQNIFPCFRRNHNENNQIEDNVSILYEDLVDSAHSAGKTISDKSSDASYANNSEDVKRKIDIERNFKEVYDGETLGQEFECLDDFSFKKSIQYGKEMYLKSTERQKIIRDMEVLYLEEAVKVETKRLKLLKNKPADLDIIHMSYNKELKLQAEEYIASSISVASIEEDLNKEQLDILGKVSILLKRTESWEEKKKNNILSQINLTENSAYEEHNIFDKPFEHIMAEDTVTEFIRCDESEVILGGTYFDE